MIKKGDFVELDYTGKIKDDKIVFDTTVEETAKTANIHNPKFKYKPVIVCIGEKHLVAGLDEAIIGKNPGAYTIEVKAEHAFGKKSAELLKLIPIKLFTKDQVQPYVGLEVNVDGMLGIVRNVSGGRVIVDFNHPLAGRDLVYDINIKRIVTDPLEKAKSVLEITGVPFESIDLADNKATIVTKGQLPEEISKELGESIKKLVDLKSVDFKTEEQAKKEIKKEIKKEEEQK
ncbi:peptidylprolyl isomerase [Candidatus Woesearchaeota archaeon]|nr:peptidylprolyl isomerase [Candidatus Woesearchaeota archaeon]